MFEAVHIYIYYFTNILPNISHYLIYPIIGSVSLCHYDLICLNCCTLLTLLITSESAKCLLRSK